MRPVIHLLKAWPNSGLNCKGPCNNRSGAFARVYLSLVGIYSVLAGIPLHMRESIHNLWPLCLGPMGVAIEDLALIQSHSDPRIARGVITADPIGLETQRTLNSLQLWLIQEI